MANIIHTTVYSRLGIRVDRYIGTDGRVVKKDVLDLKRLRQLKSVPGDKK